MTLPNHHFFQDVRKSKANSDGFASMKDEMLETHSEESSVEISSGNKALRRILGAYSVYDRELEYSQGMNYIVRRNGHLLVICFPPIQCIDLLFVYALANQAAMFLTVMPEEEAFWMFAGEFVENYLLLFLLIDMCVLLESNTTESTAK